MDRIETDAIADQNGMVHVHVGAPGAHVHVAVEARAPQFAAVDDLEAFSCRFAGRVWLTPDLLTELREEGRR